MFLLAKTHAICMMGRTKRTWTIGQREDGGQVVDHSEEPRRRGGLGDVNIQWKGTDVCLDFSCSCMDGQKYQAHYDGYFAYVLECPRCGSRYRMPISFTLQAEDF